MSRPAGAETSGHSRTPPADGKPPALRPIVLPARPSHASRGLARRLVVNLVPLLEVLALLVFAMYLQNRALVRKQAEAASGRTREAESRAAAADRSRREAEHRARAAESTAEERARRAEALAGDLREQTRRGAALRMERERFEEQLRATAAELEAALRQGSPADRARAEQRARESAQRRAEIAEALADAMGLSDEDLRSALRNLPAGEADQEKLNRELRSLAGSPRDGRAGRLPLLGEFGRRNAAVSLHLGEDGTLTVRSPEGVVLGVLTTGRSTAGDLAGRVDELVRMADDGRAIYLVLTWGNALLADVRTATAAMRRAADLLKLRPGGESRGVFGVVMGFQSPTAPTAPVASPKAAVTDGKGPSPDPKAGPVAKPEPKAAPAGKTGER